MELIVLMLCFNSTNHFKIQNTKKKLILSLFALLICFSCNQNTDTTKAIAVLPFDNMSDDPLEGVWQQTKSYTIWNGDTVNYHENLNQHKIYLDGYFMWNADPDPDSVEWHGFGTYIHKNDTLIEKYLSMSNHMKLFLGSDKEAMLKVDLDENSYKQVIEGVYNDTTYQMIEHFKRLK